MKEGSPRTQREIGTHRTHASRPLLANSSDPEPVNHFALHCLPLGPTGSRRRQSGSLRQAKALFLSRECLIQIGEQVLAILYANRETQQSIGQAVCLTNLGWYSTVGHASGMADQRFDTT